MTNVRRYYEGGYYFFTICSYQRKPILTEPAVVNALRMALRETMKTHHFKITAWVTLPDHIHCVLYIPDHQVAVRIAKIKALVTRALPGFSSNGYGPHYSEKSRKTRQLGRLWQKGYWEHTIRNERELELYTLYTCYNPVKHGYVEHAVDWSLSSLTRGISNGRYPAEWQHIDASWLDDSLATYDLR